MNHACVLFLNPDPAQPPRWWRLRDGRRADAGEGWPLVDADEPLVAIAPAASVTLHWAELPSRSPAQTLAAARVLADEAIASAGATHVAVATVNDATAMRAVAVVAPETMAAWVAALEADGLGEAPMVPAPLLLPIAEDGFVRADLPFAATVRGRGTGFADEPGLTDLVIGDAPIDELHDDDLDLALAGVIAAPPLDLRQGAFARVRRRGIDWPLVRRLAILLGMVMLATLSIDLVQIARFSFGADAVEAQADAAARAGLPRGGSSGDAPRMLDARLAGLRGPGLGFSRTAAAAYGAVRQVNSAEATGVAFQPNGALKLSLSVANEGDANAVKSRLEAAGFDVTASVFQGGGPGGRLTGDMTVVPR